MKRQFRPAMIVPIVVVLALYIASFMVLRSLSPGRWLDFFKFQILRHQDPARLVIADWARLFKGYYQAGQENRALQTARQMAARPEMKLHDRLWFAGHCGRFLRRNGNYGMETELYEILLKETDPVYYHLFRAVSCESQGDVDCEKGELSQARASAQRQDLSGFINSQLVQHKIEEKKP